MKCKILHESTGRIRVHVVRKRMTTSQADILEAWLLRFEGIKKVSVFERTCDVIILYSGDREGVLHSLAVFSFETTETEVPAHTGRALNREYQEKLIMTVAGRFLRRTFLPAPVRMAFVLWRGIGYVRKGAACLLKGKLEVPVLDAAAISVALARGSFGTAGSIMFMLRIGEILEEWTHRKSVSDLARSMSLNINKVWMRSSSGEVLVPIEEVKAGDEIIVRTGSLVPLDGFVCGGQASVNQASMTGESLPVNKENGSYVYAGTVVEEGELLVRVDKTLGSGRYDRAVKMIEESERLKSASEARASHLADRLVPWSLGGTLFTWFLTRNIMKTLSVLMVDFSCALKLAMPISTLSAMRECGDHKILVKGGRFLEAAAEADTIVFDKTGTLTNAEPHVAEVMTFGRRNADEMLRLAACLEEHYPHSIANAVVREAKIRNLHHDERHAKVEYVVAHGIASRIDGKKVIIGSYHFVFEDEKTKCSEKDKEKLASLPPQYSHLYLAIGGRLAAVICIEDSLRPEAPEVLKELRKLGISRVVMMTGDNERTAAAVASMVGVDEFRAGVLPEDKADFVRREREAGHQVIMVGDGVNDSPALSESDAGIAISEGAAIAREIADITISENDLRELVVLRKISAGLMRRIDSNYRSIISFNMLLILLGVAGFIDPSVSALLHNMSTLAIGVHSMTDLI